jgi:hypothetical protein
MRSAAPESILKVGPLCLWLHQLALARHGELSFADGGRRICSDSATVLESNIAVSENCFVFQG